MGFCDSVISCLFWIVNFVFAIGGLVVIGIGSLAYSRLGDFSKILTSPVASPPIVLIVVGCIVFVIAFFGCCGAFTKSSCMLTAYGVLVILIFVIQVAVAVVFIVNGKTTEDAIAQPLMEELKIASTDKDAYDLLSLIQKELKCCGVYGIQDYGKYPGGPIASCPAPIPIPPGCATVLADFIDDNATIVGGIGIGIGVIEILGSVCGFLLSSYFKRGM